MRASLIGLTALLLLPATQLAAQVQFEEDNGYVVMEMESVPIPSGVNWIKQTSLADFTGSGYYQYKGNNICSGPANSPLRYTFRIKNAGVYELRLRGSRIYHCVEDTPTGANNHCQEGGGAKRGCKSFSEPNGNTCANPSHCIRTDLSNDAFISVEDANGNHVNWVGQNDTKVTKLFGGGNNAWRWTGKRALDPGGAKRDAHWDLKAGDYTLVVQGRSQDFRIDRMVFFDTDGKSINGAEQLPETLFKATPEPDMGNAQPDMATNMDKDMNVAQEDMSSSSEDMATAPAKDMSSGGPNPKPDMSSTGTPDAGGKSDMGTGPGNMADAGDEPTPVPIPEEEGCASAPSNSPVHTLWLLLGGVLLWVRRRR